MSNTMTLPALSDVNNNVLELFPCKESIKEAIVKKAGMRGKEQNILCAGAMLPKEAWTLTTAGEAVIVDVRTLEECKFVGRVPHALHVPWMCGISMVRNPGFINEIEKMLPKDKLIILLCRSGQRSVGAAEALTRAGFTAVFNLDQGFEGSMDENRQRGRINGWRHSDLPWIQD